MGADTKSYVSFSLREVHPLTSSKDYGQGNGAKGLSSLRTVKGLSVLPFINGSNKDYKFSSVISRPWVLVQSGAWTLNLPHGSPALYNMS